MLLHIYIHTYIYTYTHTYIHTYLPSTHNAHSLKHPQTCTLTPPHTTATTTQALAISLSLSPSPLPCCLTYCPLLNAVLLLEVPIEGLSGSAAVASGDDPPPRLPDTTFEAEEQSTNTKQRKRTIYNSTLFKCHTSSYIRTYVRRSREDTHIATDTAHLVFHCMHVHA